MGEKRGESIRPELLSIQTQLAKLRIENWLAFFSFRRIRLTRSQTIGTADQKSDVTTDQDPDPASKKSQSDGTPGSIKR